LRAVANVDEAPAPLGAVAEHTQTRGRPHAVNEQVVHPRDLEARSVRDAGTGGPREVPDAGRDADLRAASWPPAAASMAAWKASRSSLGMAPQYVGLAQRCGLASCATAALTGTADKSARTVTAPVYLRATVFKGRNQSSAPVSAGMLAGMVGVWAPLPEGRGLR
jgi:hypothetical protein